MSDTSTFGGSFGGGASAGADVPPAQGPVSVGGAPLPDTGPCPAPQPGGGSSFGSGLGGALGGPNYRAPDPQASALDQTADMLQQRVNRANSIATNPILNFFDPEGAAAARSFVPKATEDLQKIKAQKADMAANRQQAETLGLHPGDVADEASQADRVEVAKARALKGDLNVFKGLQVVDPKSAEAIQDQVHEVVASHLTKAQYAYDSLAAMPNQRQYDGKLAQLRKEGTLTDLETLGLKVGSYDQFNASKAKEGQALREARIGVDAIRQKLEDRNTYQPMEKKEAETYNGRITTAYGDQVTNGTWSRNGASNTRGLVVNGMADPRELGKNFSLATPDQRKAFLEESDKSVPKEEREKARGFNRTYQLATTDAKGNKLPDGSVNTNPNVQQGMAEGLTSMLRGGNGGANVGLLKIETNKRGFLQGLVDKISTEKGAAINELKGQDVNPYLSKLTQGQIRDVMDMLKQYNDQSSGSRLAPIAQRAGALGLDASSLGFGKGENAAVDAAIEEGRKAQVDRMMPYHQAIGGGDGVLQIGAQRAGAGATALPPGATPTNQLPGGDRIASPVAQAAAPLGQPGPGVGPAGPQPAPLPPAPGSAGPSPAGSPPPSAGPAGGAGPVSIAGQQVNFTPPPGASPAYLASMQRIESGNEKSPWTAGAKGSSASGAFQMIDGTWAANKPPGAPARAKDATPAQQTQAIETFTAKNAASLKSAGLPVNDTNLYVAHNLGAGGANSLLRAAPNADARTVVGEDAAKNNPLFFKGRPTVATVLARYQNEMEQGGQTGGNIADAARHSAHAHAGAAAPADQGGGLMSRISRLFMQGVPEGERDQAAADAGNAAVNNAPAIGSTLGAVGGSLAGPGGTVAGGAAGGSAGQALKDYLQGNAQSPAKIAEEGALGGVLGVGGPARPILGAAARTIGAGAVEGGAEALKGGDAGDIADKTVTGLGEAAGGELFGRSLGMIGHKVWNMFAPDAKKAVQGAAKAYHEATQTLETETPKLPGVGGAAGAVNPKYEAAEAAKAKAETVLKDAGLKPEEAAYAHKVSSDTSPPSKREAEASRPGAVEKANVGKGYQQLENEVGDKGVGAPKASPKLPDGPRAAVESGKVVKSAANQELADHVEMAITAPAANWQEKWTQLKDARSDLLTAEREAMNSTAKGKTQTAKDMRTLADTVRKQQERVAGIVFGEKDGPAFMGRLKVLDTRYRNLMEATNGGDLAAAAQLKGEAGREADKKFRAFAHDDKVALAAWGAMRKKGGNVEQDVLDQIRLEKVPYIGAVVGAGRYMLGLRKWATERAAGSPATFADFMRENMKDTTGRTVRDFAGTAAQRGATMQ